MDGVMTFTTANHIRAMVFYDIKIDHVTSMLFMEL